MTPKQTFAVRLTEAQHAALKTIAERTKQDVSNLIRLAVDALIDHYDANGRRLVLPLNFDEVIGHLLKSGKIETDRPDTDDPPLSNRMMLNDAPAPYNKKK